MHPGIVIILVILFLFGGFCYVNSESFTVGEHYILGPNYESGANMLRGDLPIQPQKLGWFDSEYGPSSLAPGFFPTVTV